MHSIDFATRGVISLSIPSTCKTNHTIMELEPLSVGGGGGWGWVKGASGFLGNKLVE